MRTGIFQLPPSFKQLAEEGVTLPQGAQIVCVDADAGVINLVCLYPPDAPMIARRLVVVGVDDEIPDELLPRLQFLGVFNVHGLMERMFGFQEARGFLLYVEREESFWSRNPADILFDLLKDDPRIDLSSLTRFRDDARAYFAEPVVYGYAGDDEPREREVLYPVGEPSRSPEEIRNAVRETMRERKGGGDEG